jgi:hypothetical protein
MNSEGKRNALGWTAVAVAILFPPLSFVVPIRWTGSYDLPYFLMWVVGISASITAARILTRQWYWLTAFWVTAFGVISVIMLTGDFAP